MRDLFIIIFIGLSAGVFGQNKIPTPQYVNSIEGVEKIILPDVQNETLKSKELEKRKPGRAHHFAHPIKTEIDIKRNGTWEYLYNDMAIWRLRIQSKHAHSLNLGFSEYILPEGAELYIYSPGYSELMGPFTIEDNDAHLQLWTPVIEGDEIILELHTSIDKINEIYLHLSYVNHDFLNLKNLKNSGSCNLDVVCAEADGFPEVEALRNQIQSVGGYTLNGIAVCTGMLINNTRSDCTPYFLTAYHCEVTENNAASVVVYWNYQNSNCRSPNSPESGTSGDGSKESFSLGSNFIAGYSLSDFTLLELDDPIDPNFQPYFSGWERSAALPASAVSIHHPGVEEKRISFDFDTLEVTPESNQDSIYLRVLDWDIGTTEDGSSGAPLFNENGLFVGQLNGGIASCSNDLWDEYGWIYKSWEGGGTPETRLKDWLDPDKTGVQFLEGRSCAFVLDLSEPSLRYCSSEIDSFQFFLSPNEFFIDSVKIDINRMPVGLDLEIETPKVAPGDSTIVQIRNLSSLSTGQYSIEFKAEDSQNITFSNFLLDVISEAPMAPNLLSPVNDFVSETPGVQFSWNGQNGLFQFQLAEDLEFEMIILNLDSIVNTSLSSPELNPRKTYYWRVREINLCGKGEWSDTFNFKIGNVVCFTISANDLPMEIGEEADIIVNSEINFPFGGNITDVNLVNISGKHSFISDLIFRLTDPNGTEISLLEFPCADEDNFEINFDDELGLKELNCPIDDAETYIPSEPLSTFKGKNAKGYWKFSVVDAFSLDGGSFDNWALQVCLEIASVAVIITEQTKFDICNQEELIVPLLIGGGFSENIELSAIDPSEKLRFDFTLDTNSEELNYIARVQDIRTLDPGANLIYFVASDGVNSDTLKIELERLPGPEAPVLLKPEESKYTLNSLPAFRWSNIMDAQSYFIEIASDSLFQDIVEDKTIIQNQYLINANLVESQRYYWRVKSIGDCGESQSQFRYFDIKPESRDFETSIESLKIFPNPANSEVQLSLNTAVDERIIIEIFSSQGKIVREEYIEIEQLKKQIPLQLLDQGIYFLRFRTEKNDGVVHKIIIQR